MADIRPHATRVARAHLRLAIVGSFSLLVIACGHETPYVSGTSYQPAVVVHGMLAVGDAEHVVVVEHTRGIEEGYFFGITAIRGAAVTIADGSVVHALGERPGAPGTYAASFTAEPGRRYLLEVREPGGATIRGSTRVPAPPALVLPEADTTLPWGRSMTVLWRSGAGAAGYAIVEAAPGTAEEPFRVFQRAAIRDTAFTYTNWTGGGDVHLRIASVDSAFDAYYSPRTTAEGGDRRAVRTTLEGGYGVFASYSMSETRIVRRR